LNPLSSTRKSAQTDVTSQGSPPSHHRTDTPDDDKQFALNAVGGAFDEVNLLSADGFKEIKHIEISGRAAVVGSAVPEPSTWALMGLGFAALGLLGYRKTRSDNTLA
jgi:PEP-CTERM motif